MANLSQIKRERMVAYLDKLKELNKDDEHIRMITEIENALTEKKYGLVWEEHSEKVNEMLKDNIPVFMEDESRKIVANEEEPYNFLLEGDNLHSLKLLEKTHKGKIDIIYIDPPYNTGNKDFIYNDQYVDKTDGYSHSKWLSFMEKRLEIAKGLLSDEGVIFISIDDNEQAQLKLLCDSIFGEENFLAQIIWERAFSPVNLKKHFSECHDYIICYAKKGNQAISNKLQRSDNANKRYKNPDNDIRGCWTSTDISVGPAVKENIYEIITPSGRKVFPPEGRSWVLSKKRFHEFVDDNRIWFGKNGDNIPRIKKFLSEVNQVVVPMTIWKYTEVDHSQTATKQLKEIFKGEALFTYPKPIKLIQRCISLYTKFDSVVVDFFAGSGTTGHAVAQLNKEDGGNRKYILCTNNENKICEEVTYQRLKNIQEELPHNLKYYKTDFIEKFSEDEEDVSDKIMEYIKELIELEYHIEIDGKKYIILEDEEEVEEILDKIENKGTIFMKTGIFLSSSDYRKIDEKEITKIDIPEYYFREELREVGEI